jgi:cell shape-determining protein MreC
VSNFETLKSQASDPLPRPRESMDRILATSSSGQGKEFLHLEEELNEIGKLKENAFEEEIMMFDSSEDNLRKVQEIIAENARLKERLAALEARAGRDTREDNEKLRKRLAVMKKRNEEL